MVEQPNIRREPDQESFLRQYILLNQEDRRKIRQFFNEYINPFPGRERAPAQMERREKTGKGLGASTLVSVGVGGLGAVAGIGHLLKNMLMLDCDSSGNLKIDKQHLGRGFEKGYKWASGRKAA